MQCLTEVATLRQYIRNEISRLEGLNRRDERSIDEIAAGKVTYWIGRGSEQLTDYTAERRQELLTSIAGRCVTIDALREVPLLAA